MPTSADAQHTLDDAGTLCRASHCQHCDACGQLQELFIAFGDDGRGAWLHVHCDDCDINQVGHAPA